MDGFPPNFHRMVGICLSITDLMLFFSDRSRDVALTTNFRVKMGEIGPLTFIRRLGIPKGIEYRSSDLKRSNGNHFSTLCINLMRFGSVTPEFTKVNGVDPFIDKQFSYVRLAAPQLDQ